MAPIQLDPFIQEALDNFPTDVDMTKFTPHQLRAAWESPDATAGVVKSEELFFKRVDETVIKTPAGVSLAITRPKGTEGKILPVILYLHGGGWFVGNAKIYRGLRSYFTLFANAAVVFVNYSLSPETPYPGALEECYSVLSWIVDTNPAIHCLDSNKISVMGDSAGGNIAAGLSILDKQRHPEGTRIQSQVLFYPPVQARNYDNASYKAFDKGYMTSVKSMQQAWDYYVPDYQDRLKSTAAPLEASIDELKGVASTFIVTAEADVLRDEGEEYAQKLMKAGVNVVALRALGTIHGMLVLNISIPVVKSILDQSITYLLNQWKSEEN